MRVILAQLNRATENQNRKDQPGVEFPKKLRGFTSLDANGTGKTFCRYQSELKVESAWLPARRDFVLCAKLGWRKAVTRSLNFKLGGTTIKIEINYATKADRRRTEYTAFSIWMERR
jgi:hypothetical protein